MSRLTQSGRFTVLAIDHGEVLRRHFDDVGIDSTDSNIERSKLAVVGRLSPGCSAVLVDLGLAQHPEFLRAKVESDIGLVISVDESNYDTLRHPPPSNPDYGLFEGAKQVGADALKVVVYYDRASRDTDVRLQRVASYVEMSKKVGLPLLVEPLPIRPEDEVEWPVALIARDMADAGAAVIKVPLPGQSEQANQALAERITELIHPVPWIVLSSGVAFPEFLVRLRGAMAGGASGFAAGRSIWGDSITRTTDGQAMDEAQRRLQLAIDATVDSPPPVN